MTTIFNTGFYHHISKFFLSLIILVMQVDAIHFYYIKNSKRSFKCFDAFSTPRTKVAVVVKNVYSDFWPQCRQTGKPSQKD